MKVRSHHIEQHRTSSETLKDIVLGMSDGLTVPFALAAGLSGVVSSTLIIVVAGIAEIAAGGIAMGLGGYMAAKTALEHYQSEYKREMTEVEQVPEIEAIETGDILKDFGVPESHLPIVVNGIKSNPKRWVDFMMRFELGLEKPDPKRVLLSPITIGLAYVIGGLIPLSPYFLLSNIHNALLYSIAITLVALFSFGSFKGHFLGKSIFKSACQTTLIGGIAASAAFGIARLIT